MDVSQPKLKAVGLQKGFGFILASEMYELHRLANLLPENPVVINIGAGPGTSGMTFLESRKDITLYTVDIQEKSSPHGSLESERNAFKTSGFEELFNVRWFQIHGDSPDVGASWENGPVDMVFIDGLHTYDGCIADIEMWVPHIKDGGFVTVHDYDKLGELERTRGDYNKAEMWGNFPYVTLAVDELLRTKYEEVSLAGNMVTFRIAREDETDEDICVERRDSTSRTAAGHRHDLGEAAAGDTRFNS